MVKTNLQNSIMDGGGKIKNWILVAQPWAFYASGSPALVAFSYIFFLYKTGGYMGEINWGLGIIGFIAMLIIHASGNSINEYQDFTNGIDGKEKMGAPRLIVQGVFKPKTVLYYSLILLAIGCLIGIYLFVKTGWPLLIIGLVGVLSVLLYHKFKYIALGDLLIYICYAMAVPMGIGYVLTEQLLWVILLITAPTGLLVVGILHANNTRDIVQDRESGIKTQAMILGLEGSQIAYQTLVLVSYLLIAIYVSMNLLHPITFIVLLSFTMANKNIKTIKKATYESLDTINILDAKTSMLAFVFSLLLSTGNFIAPFI